MNEMRAVINWNNGTASGREVFDGAEGFGITDDNVYVLHNGEKLIYPRDLYVSITGCIYTPQCPTSTPETDWHELFGGAA